MLYKVTYTELTFCYHVSETSNVDTMCETTFDIMAIKLLEKNLERWILCLEELASKNVCHGYR